jgi:hypothetical protein
MRKVEGSVSGASQEKMRKVYFLTQQVDSLNLDSAKLAAFCFVISFSEEYTKCSQTGFTSMFEVIVTMNSRFNKDSLVS